MQLVLSLCYISGANNKNMTSYQSKAQIFTNIVSIFEDQLQWIISKQYTSEPHYRALYCEIQELAEVQPGDLHEKARELTTKLQELSVYIGEKMKNMIDLSFNEVHLLRQKMAQSEQQIRNLRDKIQSLEQTRQILKDKVSTWEKQYDILKAQAIDMQHKLQMELKLMKTEKKELKRTFLQVQQDTEQERKLIENLQTQQLEISEHIQQSKRQRQMLMEEIDILKKKLEAAERKIQSSEGRYSYSGKKIAMLEEQIESKNQLIEQYYQSQRPKVEPPRPKELQMLSHIIKNDPVNDMAAQRVSSEVETFKLGELVHLNSQQYEMEYKRNESVRNSVDSGDHNEIIKINCSAIEEDPVEQDEKDDPKKEPHVPDLYFAFYLLTIQSIKLKQNREEYFHVDMTPFYQQLLKKAVPFHQWDDWIKEKLHSLVGDRS